MKTKALLIPIVAVLAVMVLGFASALTNSLDVSINDAELSESVTTAGFTGETVPVRVVFTANENATDVRIKVRMEGFRDEVSASTARFNLVDGSTYSKLLALELPASIKDTTKEVTLYVSVFTSTDKVEEEFLVRLQRESYELGVLAVDFPSKVSAGDTVPVSVVVKNIGMERLDDGFVIVSIPSLGVASKAYFGDTIPVENCDEDCDEEDSVQRIVNIQLPEDSASGVYELVAKVYNEDAVTTVSKMISVEESSALTVIPASKSQDIKAGETKTYDLILVNSGKNIRVFNLQTVSGNALTVSAPSVVTVAAGSSTTVPITVTASNSAEVGSYTFSVVVDGKQSTFGANVVSGRAATNSVVALTVILVIIFVVLLIVLIVLLTRKEKPAEEVETSYY